jgi:hypothetical protein
MIGKSPFVEGMGEQKSLSWEALLTMASRTLAPKDYVMLKQKLMS